MSGRTSEKIAKGLMQKPAYLLVFGVCILILGSGSTIGFVGLFLDKPGATQIGLFLGIAALFAVIAVVLVVEREGRGAPEGRTGDTDFDPILDAIYENIRQSLGRSHPVFRERMASESEGFRATTGLWAAGQLRTTQRTYNEVLLSSYERASKSIFATSTLDYLSAWQSFLGEEILKSHGSNSAQVTRVFIFESRESVPPEALQVMEKQYRTGRVNVLVYGITENVRYQFPGSINMNFAFFDDGDVIASTDPGGPGYTGTFYFKEPDFVRTYTGIVAALTKGSKSFEEFMKARDTNWQSLAPSAKLSAPNLSSPLPQVARESVHRHDSPSHSAP